MDSRDGVRNRLLVHPSSAKLVLEVLRSPDGVGDITKTVMTDPALAASVLRAANSAHLGYSRRIGSIRQASVMLGGSLVSSLAASRVADLVFDAEAPDYPDWLWLHSISVAAACTVLARHIGESIDEAFTVGLLHDVGWLLAASNNVSLPQTDTDHSGTGADLLARWNLPDRIVAAVHQHHTRTNALNAPLDRMIVAAHGLVGAMGVPCPERSISPTEALGLVNLTDIRQKVVLGQIESELIGLTNELTARS
ncbi:MAG: putative domain HDIG-containing protein [Ilumatobacteraceae bacterium]|nr:putative domain HDIG-containing protein [Ilumatobacteraceae bacterium]